MRRSIQLYGKWLIAIAALAVLATISGLYIVINQRLQLPWKDSYSVRAELATVQGLNPGLGQAVNVAGVRVGTIARAHLEDGVAVLDLEIDPGKLPAVYRDASADLVPNTPLKDMQVELRPGTPKAGRMSENGTIDVLRTSPPVDSDELTNSLDADTRAFFETLMSGASIGLEGRGEDLREVFKALEPTADQAREISSALAARRRELRRLVGNLAVLSRAAATKDRELTRVVSASNATFGAIAAEETALRASLQRLPGSLANATDSIDEVTALADELGPTLDRLLPAVRSLPAALRAAGPLAREATPILRTKLRPLVREIQPLAADLAPTTRDLRAVTPNLFSAFKVLNYVVNELAYNPPGDNEGFLYWLAWFAHNGNSMLSTADAHGGFWRGLALLNCSSLGSSDPALGDIVNQVLGPLPICTG